jgi:hypothetical protein
VKHLLVAICVCVWVALCVGAAAADRDPTSPPPEVGAPAGTTGATGPAVAPSYSVIVQNGQPFWVVGTRLYAVGQRVGQVKLERITETEIWLREDGQLRKVPRFAGIQRSATPACTAFPSAAAPCKGAQP